MKPNILFITADDMNYNSTGIYGCEVENVTPNINNLGEEGIRFEHAHVNIAICQPSRQVLMTGRYPHRNGAPGFDPIDSNIPTITEELDKEGYINGIVGKVIHLEPEDKYCWDTCIKVYNDENDYGRNPELYFKYCKEFFEKANNKNQPFFMMANSHDPHRPFVNSKQEKRTFDRHIDYSREYNSVEISVPDFLPDIPPVRKEIAQYYSSVHRCDETVGQILRALEETGNKENTIVMFISDNGMAFPFAKTNCYLNSTRTPWIVRWPEEIKAGVVDKKHIISGIDFMPTILDAVGLEQIEGMDGESFLPLLKGETQSNREDVFTVMNKTYAERYYPMRCIQNKKFGYIFNSWSDNMTFFINESKSGLTYRAMEEAAEDDGEIKKRVDMYNYRQKEEFYDFENDPDALNNLINDPEYEQEINELRNKLIKKMAKTEDPLLEEYKQSLKGILP